MARDDRCEDQLNNPLSLTAPVSNGDPAGTRDPRDDLAIPVESQTVVGSSRSQEPPRYLLPARLRTHIISVLILGITDGR